MIKVFRGSWRGIGAKEKQFGMLFDFKFREIIHLFNGAKLHVFMAIALHSNEQGFSWPSYDLLESETGYTRATIALAIDELCELKIENERVLARYRERDEAGRYIGSNHYLIFPTREELESIQSLVFPTLENSNGGITKLKVKPVKDKDKPKRIKGNTPDDARPRTPTVQQQMVEVLAALTGMDYHIKSNASRLGKTASELVSSRYTPENVKAFAQWWRNDDWRGRKGDKPKLSQVTELIGVVRGGGLQDLKPDPIDVEALRRAVREAKPADDGMEY